MIRCCLIFGGVDRGNPQGKDFRGVDGYLNGIWGNPSLVKIHGKTKKNHRKNHKHQEESKNELGTHKKNQ